MLENNVERKRFYGLSPGSLANGALGRDYQGHSFWDSETWMYPSILLLWPHIAKDFLLYRMANVVPARDRANATGYRGIRYAGRPSGCPNSLWVATPPQG